MAESMAKVLIVEDDITSQQYYSVIFDGKYEICMVSTVEEAKQAFRENIFKVAIIDISLPGGESGIDLIKDLKAEFSDNLIPIVVSAHAFPKIRVEALEAGAVEFFTKPIMSDVLLDVVEKYVTGSK